MSNFPDDIIKAAEALDIALSNQTLTTHGDHYVLYGMPDYIQRRKNLIASALMAERERCAKVADHLNGWGADNGKGGHAEHIASVIRGCNQ